jgi:hypothetical protein
VLDKISGAVLIGARQRQARIQLLTGVVEQLLVDNKRARDTEAAAMNMQLVTWRDARRERGVRAAGSGDALRTGGSRRRRGDDDAHQPSLNLIPTIQQAIANLLLTYEPEFLRFGYQLFMAFATILIAGTASG